MSDSERDDVAKDVSGESVEFTIPGMPETTVFWNTNDTITISQRQDHEDVIVVVTPEMVERLCEMLKSVRDAIHNF